LNTGIAIDLSACGKDFAA